MSDSNCVICLELLSHPVAAVNPCGHCFHEQCFRDWDASKRGQGETTRCPMCNKNALALQRIFIHLPYGDEENEDDSVSLSSCEDSSDSLDDVGERKIKADTDEPKLNSDDMDDGDIDNNIDDEIDTRAVREEAIKNEVLIDLCSSPPPAKALPRKSHASNKKDDNDYAIKLKRKAKRFKKRIKMLESQRKDFVDKERTLSQQHSEAKERLAAIDTEFKVLKAKVHLDKLALEHRRLEVVQIRAERDSARASHQSAAKQVKSLEAELSRLRENFQHNLSRAQAQGMAEAQLLKEQHQQLGDDNNKLKQAVLLKDSQIHDLNRQLQRMQSLIQGKVDLSMKDLASNSRKRAAQVGRSLLEAEHMLSSQRDDEEEERRRSLVRDERTELQQRMKAKISHQAARFSAAVGKKNALREMSMNTSASRQYDSDTDDDAFPADRMQRACEQKLPARNPSQSNSAKSSHNVSLNLSCSSKRSKMGMTSSSSSLLLSSSRSSYSRPPPNVVEERPKKKQSTITTMFHRTKG